MEVLYAKVGSVEACYVHVFDEETGEALKHVVEASAVDGWFTRYKAAPDGSLLVEDGLLVLERVERPIRMTLDDSASRFVREQVAYANAMLRDG